MQPAAGPQAALADRSPFAPLKFWPVLTAGDRLG
jgi:hypothetical protein